MKKPHTQIGIINTSSPANAREMQKGLKKLKSLNLSYATFGGVLKQATQKHPLSLKYLSSTERQKIRALKAVSDQKHIKTLFPVRGGYGSIRLLDHLTPSLIKKLKSKIIWGFSDLTTLQNALYFVNQQPWVHSPLLISDSFQSPNTLEKKFWDGYLGIQKSPQNVVSHALFSEKQFSRQVSSKSAVLLGGNLACFTALCGHPRFFKIPREKFYFFLEDISEKPHRIDRLLYQLKGTGFFKNCQAILLGQFTDCGDWMPVFQAFSQENKIPLFWGLQVGHDRPHLPLTMGLPVRIVKKKSNSYSLEVPILFFE